MLGVRTLDGVVQQLKQHYDCSNLPQVSLQVWGRLTAMDPSRGLAVSHRIAPVAQSRAAQIPLSVIFGLPSLGFSTGDIDSLQNNVQVTAPSTYGTTFRGHGPCSVPNLLVHLLALFANAAQKQQDQGFMDQIHHSM